MYGIAFGFAVGTGAVRFLRLLRARAFLAAACVLGLGAASAALYSVLPITRLFLPGLSLFSVLGILLGIANSLLLDTGNDEPPAAREVTGLSPAVTTALYGLACFNFFLLVAPYSTLVPSGFEEAPPWSRASLLLRQSDAVAIGQNLVFVTGRHALRWLVGNSLLINNLISMILCSVGIGFLAGGLGLIAGAPVAALAVAMAATERWVMAAAFAGNLPASLIAVCGLLFFVLSWIVAHRPRARPVFDPPVFLLVLFTCLLAMYSYAAVRIPFVLSLGLIAIALLAAQNGGARRRIARLLATILAPATLAVALVLAFGYRGNFASFKKDLFVQAGQELLRPHPGPEGAREFAPVHNPDAPIWVETARPTDGRNISVMWTRTPREVIRAFRGHVANVLKAPADLSLISPFVFFLAAAALLRFAALPPPMKLAAMLMALWSGTWIAAYLLVPDPDAYRRGIPFSAAFAVLGVFAFAGRPERRQASLLSMALGLLLVSLRFPHELAISSQSRVRPTMFTVCDNALAIRALLAHNFAPELRAGRHYLVIPRGGPAREASCLRSAAASDEWKRRIVSTEIINPEPDQVIGEISRLPSSALAIVHCSIESTRDRDMATLCDGTAPGIVVRAGIAVLDKAAPSKWVLVSRSLP